MRVLVIIGLMAILAGCATTPSPATANLLDNFPAPAFSRPTTPAEAAARAAQLDAIQDAREKRRRTEGLVAEIIRRETTFAERNRAAAYVGVPNTGISEEQMQEDALRLAKQSKAWSAENRARGLP